MLHNYTVDNDQAVVNIKYPVFAFIAYNILIQAQHLYSITLQLIFT